MAMAAAGKKELLNDAVASFKKALAVNPKEPLAHFNLGVIYWQIGNFDEAINSFSQAIQLDPNLMDAYANLGFLHI